MAAKRPKPTREDALKIARYIGCSGAHQDESGTWFPCADSETLNRISNQAEPKSAERKKRRKRRRFVRDGYEPLGARGVLGIDFIPGVGLVSQQPIDAKRANPNRLAATPAPKKDRVFGSSVNKPGTASSARSGSSIEIDAATETALVNKVRMHNEKMRDRNAQSWSMATLGKLKAVYRRGAGAFSVSHRPGMTRNQWAMGRVNAFLRMLSSGRPANSRYINDNDLLHRDHPWRSRGGRAKSAFIDDPTAAFLPEEKAPLRSLAQMANRRIGDSSRLRRRFRGYGSRLDGDGDGFTTNPATGEDNVPVAAAGAAETIASLFERLKDPDGGFTFSMSNMDDVKSGWAIARKGEGIRVPVSRVYDKDGNVTQEGIDYLEAFLEMQKDKFLEKPGDKRRIALGAWHNPQDSTIYFDVTDVHAKDAMTEGQAIKEAKKQNQISLADLDELHAALSDEKWDDHKVFHNSGGDGSDLVPDSRFAPFLRAVQTGDFTDLPKVKKRKDRQVVRGEEGVEMMMAPQVDLLAAKHGVAKDWDEVRALPQPRRKEIADLYDESEELVAEQIQADVRVAYEALANEVEQQFEMLTKELGVKVEFVDADPYENFYEMLDDFERNKRLKILKTSVTGGHPFMTDEQNDKFRAVHDAFGHLGTGRGFDRHGEEAAFQAHKSMFSGTAVKAAATELRGQNAFLIERGFFGPQKLLILPDEMRKFLEMLLSTKQGIKSDKTNAQDWSDFDNAYTETGSHHVSCGRRLK